jgi:hypothetical protein
MFILGLWGTTPDVGNKHALRDMPSQVHAFCPRHWLHRPTLNEILGIIFFKQIKRTRGNPFDNLLSRTEGVLYLFKGEQVHVLD